MALRVFIIWKYPLFRETVTVLLQHPEMIVVGGESDRAEARTQINRLEPDIIIIEEALNEEPVDSDIIEYLEESLWEPRVARLSLQDNELRLYQRQHRIIETKDELLALLQE